MAAGLLMVVGGGLALAYFAVTYHLWQLLCADVPEWRTQLQSLATLLDARQLYWWDEEWGLWALPENVNQPIGQLLYVTATRPHSSDEVTVYEINLRYGVVIAHDTRLYDRDELEDWRQVSGYFTRIVNGLVATVTVEEKTTNE